ncbi:MAG: hypothetical protein LBM87_00295 [Ruminococcus sp.]|jgi:hypothetical protein|nr:hypothetical protein [Ruminococcus sp.]
MWDLYNESLRDRYEDMERKYNPENHLEQQPRCSSCSSKIYPGDTIYTVDRFVYCAECVEESEYYV